MDMKFLKRNWKPGAQMVNKVIKSVLLVDVVNGFLIGQREILLCFPSFSCNLASLFGRLFFFN